MLTVNGLIWSGRDTNDYTMRDHLGFIPEFFSIHDTRSAKDQLDENYSHGGGWKPLPEWGHEPKTHKIQYPGDPAMEPIATVRLPSHEVVVVYEFGVTMVLQPSGAFEIARLD